jgi:hypothetical protein
MCGSQVVFKAASNDAFCVYVALQVDYKRRIPAGQLLLKQEELLCAA